MSLSNIRRVNTHRDRGPLTARNPFHEFADQIAKYYDDPLGFVQVAFPWGEPGPLRDARGPDAWQREFLMDLGRQVENGASTGSTR